MKPMESSNYFKCLMNLMEYSHIMSTSFGFNSSKFINCIRSIHISSCHSSRDTRIFTLLVSKYDTHRQKVNLTSAVIGNIQASLSTPFMHLTIFVVIYPYRYPRSYVWVNFLVSNFENQATLFSSNHFNSMYLLYFHSWCWYPALYTNSFKTLLLHMSLKLLTTCLRQYRCCAWEGLHPTDGFLTAAFIRAWRYEIKHIPYLWVTWRLNVIRNQNQLSYDSSSTIANARGNTWPFPSIEVQLKASPCIFHIGMYHQFV